MKKHFFYLIIMISAFNSAFAVEASTESVEVPKQILSGDFGVMELVSQVKTYTITASADSADTTYVVFGQFQENFNNLEELAEKLGSFSPVLEIKNPNDDIHLEVSLGDSSRGELFYGYSSFRLEKVYDKDGNISYQKPSYAGRVYLNPVEFKTSFPIDIEEAWLEDRNGNKYYLDIDDDNELVIPGWTAGSNYLYAIIDTEEGEFWYDLNTSQLLPKVSANVSVEGVDIDGIYSIDGDFVYLTLSPEYGYTPWIEVNHEVDEYVEVNVRSQNGYRPIAVRSVTMGELRDGLEPEFHQYQNGMQIEMNEDTIYLFFEFPPQAYGSYGGGKG